MVRKIHKSLIPLGNTKFCIAFFHGGVYENNI